MAQEQPQPSPPTTLILPLEIFSDILSRLRPKELLRFKTVSKAWFSLISDPNFVKQHFRKSAVDRRLKIVAKIASGRKYGFVPIKSLLSVENETRVSEYEEVDICCPKSRIVGSCNGLICLTAGDSEIFVLNPSIRKLRKLPTSGIRERLGSLCHRGVIYGFGYDEVNDDYNVVMMVSAIGIGYHTREVEVYSMRSNRWKRVGDFPYGPHHEAGLSVCGALVWPAMSTTTASTQSVVCGVPVLNIEWKIVGLDLESGSYRDIPQPEGVQSLRDKLLGVMDGCLCIFAHFRGTRLEVWMMKEFGVQESWSKVATVPYLVKPCWSDELPFYMPLWCSKDGEMIMLFRSKFIVYNVQDGTFRYPNVKELNVSSHASIYIESLVSPCL
ncbi:unnamed protein product [Rhodiola kirilowii]